MRGVTRCEHCANRDRISQRERLRRRYRREKAASGLKETHTWSTVEFLPQKAARAMTPYLQHVRAYEF